MLDDHGRGNLSKRALEEAEQIEFQWIGVSLRHAFATPEGERCPQSLEGSLKRLSDL